MVANWGGRDVLQHRHPDPSARDPSATTPCTAISPSATRASNNSRVHASAPPDPLSSARNSGVAAACTSIAAGIAWAPDNPWVHVGPATDPDPCAGDPRIAAVGVAGAADLRTSAVPV